MSDKSGGADQPGTHKRVRYKEGSGLVRGDEGDSEVQSNGGGLGHRTTLRTWAISCA